MNRAQRRLSERVGKQLQKKPWSKFEDVTMEARLRGLINSEDIIDKAYKNTQYIVQEKNGIERKGKLYTRVMCRRCDSRPIYSWQDLYRIKNEIYGDETEAVQFMPPKSELVDSANLYWFWIVEGE